MPVLRRKFKRIDEDEGNVPEVMDDVDNKNKGTISSGDPFSLPLLLEQETPMSQSQKTFPAFADWKAFGTDSKSDPVDENKALGLEWPKLSNQNEPIQPQARQIHSQVNKPIKIPKLKANKHDDLQHNRAKEILVKVRKETTLDAFGQPLDETDSINTEPSPVHKSLYLENRVSDTRDDLANWTPFEQNTQVQNRVAWESFGSMPKPPEGSTSPIAIDIFPLTTSEQTAAKTKKEPPKKQVSPAAQEDDVSMPSTLNIQSLLERPDPTMDHDCQDSDILSPVGLSHGNAGTEDDMPLRFGQELGKVSMLVGAVPRASIAGESDAFSLGLETIDGVLGEVASSKKRQSLQHEGRESLSPTTMQAAIKKENFGRQRQFPLEKIVEVEESLGESRKDRLSSSHAPFDVSTEANNIASRLAVTSTEKHSKDLRRLSDVPTDISIVDRDNTFQTARQRIKQQRSIHLLKNDPSLSGNNSLLDTDSEVSDPVSGLHTAASGASGHKAGLIIEAQSFNSASVSTMTYPLNMKQSVDSDDTSKSENENLTSKFPRKNKTKPLGASAQEIQMLNTFLMAAGPKISSSTLSIEDREEIHNRAIKAGLPDEFVNKMLDRTAGIIRWEEHSVGTLLTSDSTSVSSRTKHSVYSSESYSTRYTKDDESIGYFSYSKTGRSPKADVGAYGCFSNLASTIWVESGLGGDDIMENVAAAISESFDDASWSRRKRRTRRHTAW